MIPGSASVLASIWSLHHGVAHNPKPTRRRQAFKKLIAHKSATPCPDDEEPAAVGKTRKRGTGGGTGGGGKRAKGGTGKGKSQAAAAAAALVPAGTEKVEPPLHLVLERSGGGDVLFCAL